jgi:hypothetical protein
MFDIETAHIAALDDTQLRELIRRLCAADLAGANSRLALAMADAAPKGSLSALTDGELFKRLFQQRHQHDPHLQRAAEICSLVYSFDVERRDEPKAELLILADLAEMGVETCLTTPAVSIC